eukprot:1158742-Pelagomonas_calceolata.AAC.2
MINAVHIIAQRTVPVRYLKRKEEKNYVGRGNSPCINKGKELLFLKTHWLRRSVSPLHHKV